MTLLYPPVFTFGIFAKQITLWAGVLLLTAGLICYFHTSRQLRAGIRSGRLVTTGMYRWSRNYCTRTPGFFPWVG